MIGCKNAYIEMRLFAIEIDKSKNWAKFWPFYLRV